MNLQILISTLFLAFFPSFALACGSANQHHFAPEERMSLADFDNAQIDYLAEVLEIARDDLVLFAGAAFVRPIDLDGDGSNELCISLQTSGTCSNGVAVCRIFVLKDWATEPLLEFVGHLLVADQTNDGSWPRLIGVWASSNGNIYRVNHEYDGETYRAGSRMNIGSWSAQTCDTGSYEPLGLCSQSLIDGMRNGN